MGFNLQEVIMEAMMSQRRMGHFWEGTSDKLLLLDAWGGTFDVPLYFLASPEVCAVLLTVTMDQPLSHRIQAFTNV